MAIQPEALDAYDDDRTLVAAFQAGDEAAFGRIVRVHYPALLAKARRRLGTGGDAEDAVQDALLRAFLALDRFGGEFNLSAWLNRILANACADAAGRRSSELRMRDRLAAWREEVSPAGEDESDADLHRIINEAIASLPESYRVAFVLREVEEKPYAEVAATMAVTEENARARVHRARTSLARALRDVSATLGAFAIPLRLATEQSLLSRWLSSRRVPIGARPAHAAQVIQHGQILAPLRTVLAADVVMDPSTPVLSLSSLTTTPIAQTLAQAATNPVTQSLLGAGAEVGRSALPMAGAALATLAAGAAAVMPVTTALPLVAQPTPGVTATPPSTSSGALVSYAQPTNAPSTNASNLPKTGATAAGTGAGNVSTSSFAPGMSATLVEPGLWGWVGEAAAAPHPAPSTTATVPAQSGSSAADAPQAQTAPSTVAAAPDPSTPAVPPSGSDGAAASTSSTTASPGDGQSQNPTATPAPTTAPDCPWTDSFPQSWPSVPTFATQPLGVNDAGAFATDPITLSNGASSFEEGRTGSAIDGQSTGAVNSWIAACLAGSSSPGLVANLVYGGQDPQGTSPLPTLHVMAAMVGGSASPQEPFTLYQGTGVWLSGPGGQPDDQLAPVPLVAEVIAQPSADGTSETAVLLIAFFGSISNLFPAPPMPPCPSAVAMPGQSNTGSTGAGAATSPPTGNDASGAGSSTASSTGGSCTAGPGAAESSSGDSTGAVVAAPT